MCVGASKRERQRDCDREVEFSKYLDVVVARTVLEDVKDGVSKEWRKDTGER